MSKAKKGFCIYHQDPETGFWKSKCGKASANDLAMDAFTRERRCSGCGRLIEKNPKGEK